MKLNIKLKRKDFEDLIGKTFLVESIGYTWEHKIIGFENNYNLVKISVRRVLKNNTIEKEDNILENFSLPIKYIQNREELFKILK